MSKKHEIGQSPFDLLLNESTPTIDNSGKATQTGTQSALSGFKFGNLLKSNNKRSDPRYNTTGYVTLFDLQGKVLSKAVLRNVSTQGLSVEAFPINLNAKETILVELSGSGLNLGKFSCEVSWVSPIPDHPKRHNAIGMNITSDDSDFKAQFNRFVAQLKFFKKAE